jgi:NhaP-type Na+/H+ or K+/H+ antiporter
MRIFKIKSVSLDVRIFSGRRGLIYKAKGLIEEMYGLTLSLIVGFLLGSSAVWLVSRINDRYTRREEALSRLLLKRAKRY